MNACVLAWLSILRRWLGPPPVPDVGRSGDLRALATSELGVQTSALGARRLALGLSGNLRGLAAPDLGLYLFY